MNQRQPYRWGAKEYLSSMEVGETRHDDGQFSWRGLQCVASVMQKDYGCKFVFRTKYRKGVRTVKRIL